MSAGTFALLVGAGVAAGLSGSVAGLASLFSYPALLAAGLAPTEANVTNTVSLAIGTLGSITASRPDLVGQRVIACRLAPIAALGGAAGAGLLLITPSGLFARIVPFLVGGAATLLLIGRRRPPVAVGRRHVVAPRRLRPSALVGALAVAVYGGYFGAAAGVLMLALLVNVLPETLPRVNALKNLLLWLANVTAAAGFALFGPVHWLTGLPLTLGLLLGSWVGPPVVRRLPANLLRIAIGVAGLGLAVKLALDAF